jgi:anti-anti-sigma regulatory factor
MSRSAEELAAVVIEHLSEILGGACSITREDLDAHADDPSMSEILTGLRYLHEDLVFRESERARAEEGLKEVVHRLEEQNREIEESRATVEALAVELSTPIIKVWEGVLMVPLIGTFDSARAHDMMDRLLSAVVREKAPHVILDLTGVKRIDTDTADRFLRVIGALRMLGTRGIVAGVPPEVSMALVKLGVDISGIMTTRDVQQALAYCMKA